MRLIDADSLLSKYPTHQSLCEKVNKEPTALTAMAIEEIKGQICDHYCMYPLKVDVTQDYLDMICDSCPLQRLGEMK